MSAIVSVLPRSAIIGAESPEDRAQSVAMHLRIGVEIGRLFDHEVKSCAGRLSSPRLRSVARAEIERRRRLS